MSTPELTSRRLDFEEFERLGESWNELVGSSASPLPFLCHEWLCHWWRHFGAGQEFVALTVSRGTQLLAGVPLALRRAGGLGRSALLAEIVGTGPVPTRGMGLADKADLVVRADAPEAGERLVAELLQCLDRVDVLDLKGLDSGSSTSGTIAALAEPRASTRELGRSVSPYLSLPVSWEEYLKSRSRNFRKHLKKYDRLLRENGEASLERLERPEDAEDWMHEAMEVNAASWKGDRGTNLFRSKQLGAFFLDLLPAMLQQGWIDLQLLRIDGKAVAYELCFDFGGRLFSYNGSFRKELARASPGTVLTAAVIESACKRGRTEYDMLRGDEEYKFRWSETMRSESRSIVVAHRLRARVYAFTSLILKERLKRSERLTDLADRLSGSLNRLRHRS